MTDRVREFIQSIGDLYEPKIDINYVPEFFRISFTEHIISELVERILQLEDEVERLKNA